MQQEYWVKQGEKAAFPEVLWARPEVKSAAGKLLVVGGHAQSFAVPAEAYGVAEKAEAGSVRVLLPDSLEKTVSRVFPGAKFAPSNPSGGFATRALAELLAAAEWADGVLLAGDIGRNSESLAMLENFAGKYSGQLTMTKDIGDFFCTQPQNIASRTETLLVLSLGQLQTLGKSLRLPYAFTSDLGLRQLVELLHDFTVQYPQLYIVTRHQDKCLIAVKGNIGTSPVPGEKPVWHTATAATAATWWLQNPTKPFEALLSSLM